MVRMIRLACILDYLNMDTKPLLNALNKVLPTNYDLEATRTNNHDFSINSKVAKTNDISKIGPKV